MWAAWQAGLVGIAAWCLKLQQTPLLAHSQVQCAVQGVVQGVRALSQFWQVIKDNLQCGRTAWHASLLA